MMLNGSLLAIAYVLAWIRLLKYAVGTVQFGPFVLMVGRIILHVIPKYVAIFIVLLLGFSGGFSIVMGVVSQQDDFSSYGNTILWGILTFLGVGDMDFLAIYDEGGVVAAAFSLIFLVLVILVLLNLLIAQMNDTYSNVASDINAEYLLQKADYINGADEITFKSVKEKHWIDYEEIEKAPDEVISEDEEITMNHLKKMLGGNVSRMAEFETKLNRITELLEKKEDDPKEVLQRMEEEAAQENQL